MSEPLRVLVVHGPNLNLLGTREPELYGSTTLDEINAELASAAKAWGAELDLDRVRATVEQFSEALEEGDLLSELERILKRLRR